jgi:YVTN family beta-propeller protein
MLLHYARRVHRSTSSRTRLGLGAAVLILASAFSRSLAGATLPDGRTVTPAGFTIPVEGFASDEALSPDRRWLAVVCEGGGAVDVISTETSVLADRLALPSADALAWTSDGLYVARGYTGIVARYAYDPVASKKRLELSGRDDLRLAPGLIGGVAENPATREVAVTRTAAHEVVVLDDATGAVIRRLGVAHQPFGVAFAGDTVVATEYDADAVALWHGAASVPTIVVTGAHPTQLLAAGSHVYVADADGHDVAAVDVASGAIARRYDLATTASPPPGQTPSGMALSTDGRTLFVTESGFDDVAVVDVASGRVRARIPTGWYPMAVAYVARAIGSKDTRTKEQLWIVSAQGLGSQPDPGGEWNGTYTGLVQHLVLEPDRFAAWSARVARDDDVAGPARDTPLPPIRHVVFIVRENKQFDEEFGDEPRANADPSLLVYGRHYTPNAHALAERYTLFDDFMGNGEASIYGHAWTTQGMANDYHERNAHARDEATPGIDERVAWSIWPYPQAGEDTISEASMDFDWFKDLDALENGPCVNTSGVFGPRGELVDELARKGVSFRVFGEQLTMRPDGTIAPNLVAHADRDYPGAHIDFDVLDTTRAKLFLDDVRAHGLAQYTYLTLPTDHTAGTKPGFYSPASYVASNDLALGTIVAGLSRRADWRSTLVFVTTDDPQGTGDHLDAHRMPAIAIGPYVRRGFVDHTPYSIPSFLRTVEALYGLAPLNIYDAAATPMTDAFARQADDATFEPLPQTVPMERNPGTAGSLQLPIDGPDDDAIAEQEWASIRGPRGVAVRERESP